MRKVDVMQKPMNELVVKGKLVNAEQLLAFDKILITPSALEHLAGRMNRE